MSRRLYVVSRHHHKHGGSSRVIHEICHHLAKNKVEIVFLSVTWDKEEERKYRFIKVPGFGLHKIPISAIQRLEIPFFTIFTSLYLAFFRRKHDLIWSPMGHIINRKAFYTAHSCHIAQIRLKIKNNSYRWIFNPIHFWGLMIDYLNLILSKRIIAISHIVKKDYLDNYKFLRDSDIEVIWHGVNTQEFISEGPRYNKARNGVRKSLGLKKSDLILLFVGFEFKRKGLHHIVSSLKSTSDRTKLIVVGKDSIHGKEIRNLVRNLGLENRVRFLGSTKEVGAYYCASDLFVFPTAMDAFGLVLIEAMASGLPILTTRLAGASELMSSKNALFIDLFKDPVLQITKNINLLEKQPFVLAKMGRESFQIAQKNTWDIVSKKYLNTFLNKTNS